MVLNRLLPIGLALSLLVVPASAEEPGIREDGGGGEVVLPLKDYLALVESAEAAQRAHAERARLQAAPLAEVVSQRTAATLEDGEARVSSEFEVLIQGHPDKPVALPLAGYPATVEVLRDGRPEPSAAVSSMAGGRGGVLLVAPLPGRYAVKVQGRTTVENLGGIGRLSFPPAAAPVSVTEVDLPAETSWTAPGGVVVEDREQNGRRIVRLAAKRGEAQVLELKRRFDSADAERLLAQAVALTIFQLRPEGPRRHDVILYEVSRGSLPGFTVDLPPGIEVEQAGTDEGAAVPTVEGGRLTVHRHRQLQGTGYLVLTSTPPSTDGVALVPALPVGIDVRARYLAVASSIAAEARPLPENAWARVDLADLPPALSEALEVIDLAAAWRLAGPVPQEGVRLAVQALPPAPDLDEPVRLRDTTTLLTVDGTLLHRDRFTLGPVTRPGAALDLVLPSGATLWSARVGEQPVRPLERGGRTSIPLGFSGGTETVVEVVSVLERVVPPGRSELGMELPQVTVPVLEHRWRVLLPEGNRYRFRAGDLRPAPMPTYNNLDVETTRNESEWAMDAITVTAESPLLDERKTGRTETIPLNEESGGGRSNRPRKEKKPAAPPQNQSTVAAPGYYDFDSFEELRQGLVGGVRPLPVSIPESGKTLYLTGVLPPARVGVELDVKAKR